MELWMYIFVSVLILVNFARESSRRNFQEAEVAYYMCNSDAPRAFKLTDKNDQCHRF